MNYLLVMLLLFIFSSTVCNRNTEQFLSKDTAHSTAQGIRIKRHMTQNDTLSRLKTDKSEWRLVSSIPAGDTSKAIKVSYKDEVGLSTYTILCAIVWENIKTGNYKCTAPWIDKYKLIIRANILDLEIQVVDKESRQ